MQNNTMYYYYYYYCQFARLLFIFQHCNEDKYLFFTLPFFTFVILNCAFAAKKKLHSVCNFVHCAFSLCNEWKKNNNDTWDELQTRDETTPYKILCFILITKRLFIKFYHCSKKEYNDNCCIYFILRKFSAHSHKMWMRIGQHLPTELIELTQNSWSGK